MRLKVTIGGTSKYIGTIKQFQVTSTAALVQGMYLEGERIMADAKSEFVPVLTGVLKGSGRVHEPRDLGNGVFEVRLTFGGPAASYALEVHERPKSIGQGKNKYLEKPFRAAVPGMAKRLEAWMDVL